MEAVIDCVISPVDQIFPDVAEEVSITEVPAQIDVEDAAVITGVAGNEFTVTVVEAELPEVHPFVITSTWNVPDAFTVMDCVVAPFDQTLLVGEDEVNVTEPPAQNVVTPLAVIVGTEGSGFTTTLTGVEEVEVHPRTVCETLYEPLVLTVIDGVISPVDQKFPEDAEDVNVTEPPSQNVVALLAVTTGAAGIGFTVIVSEAFALVQPKAVTFKVYTPLVVTVIDVLVAPVDQVFPVGEDEVNVTEPPSQNVVAPSAVMNGVAGIGFTVTLTLFETADVQGPSTTFTKYVPDVETVMDCVVSPVDHTFPVAEDEVRTIELPSQNVVAPLAVTVGVAGVGFTSTSVEAEAPEEHPSRICSTVYDPVVVTVMDCVVSPVDHTFPVEAEEVSTTEPPAEQNVVGPLAVMVGTAGIGFTVTLIAEIAEDKHPKAFVTSSE